MNSVGVVVVHLEGISSANLISTKIAEGVALTPVGRVLAVTYTMSQNWEPSICFEGIATATVLDPAGSRGESDDWEFSGNLAVRVCEVVNDARRVTSEIGVILFRRSGDKPYVRRRTMSEEQIEAARLDSVHPVFTRDVANNVWHIEKDNHLSSLTYRIGALLAWPDENIAVVASSTTYLPVSPLELDSALIGVPAKIDYPWAAPIFDFEVRN